MKIGLTSNIRVVSVQHLLWNSSFSRTGCSLEKLHRPMQIGLCTRRDEDASGNPSLSEMFTEFECRIEEKENHVNSSLNSVSSRWFCWHVRYLFIQKRGDGSWWKRRRDTSSFKLFMKYLCDWSVTSIWISDVWWFLVVFIWKL